VAQAAIERIRAAYQAELTHPTPHRWEDETGENPVVSLVVLVKLLHVLVGIWFISGLLGRWIVLARAAEASDVETAFALSEAAGVFERVMVIPGSMVVLALGVLTAWMQGQPVLGFLQGASTNWLFASLVLFLSSIPLIPLVFVPRGRRFAQALDAARGQRVVTADLTAAFRDPVVFIAHVYELLVMLVILVLMVTKPF
jgi:hypothetical protein